MRGHTVATHEKAGKSAPLFYRDLDSEKKHLGSNDPLRVLRDSKKFIYTYL